MKMDDSEDYLNGFLGSCTTVNTMFTITQVVLSPIPRMHCQEVSTAYDSVCLQLPRMHCDYLCLQLPMMHYLRLPNYTFTHDALPQHHDQRAL